MKPIKYALWGLIAGLTLLWVAYGGLPTEFEFPTIRSWVLKYSGIVSMGAMGAAMVLATRPRWLEPWLGGLDKSYRLHKWLGIAGLSGAVIHWVSANIMHWMSDLGLMEMGGPRGPKPGADDMGAIQAFLSEQRQLAEFLGEWSFYAVVALIVVALVRLVPYRWFAKTHKLIAFAYLALVFHSVVLMDIAAWTQPVGLLSGLLLLAGSVSALLVLFGRVGRRSKARGVIAQLRPYEDMDILETTIRMDSGWKGHRAGQFAFVTFDEAEGAHPYTIASAWDPADKRITLMTKALGDYTRCLPDVLSEGQPVTVEGPYGGFTFDSPKRRQIWIGGGIGITPFIARMKQIAQMPSEARPVEAVDLIHTATNMAPEALKSLKADAAAAGVTLHVLLDNRDGRLDGKRLRDMVPDWQSASVWFCGPAGFGEALGQDLTGHGLAQGDFHRELFQMR